MKTTRKPPPGRRGPIGAALLAAGLGGGMASAGDLPPPVDAAAYPAIDMAQAALGQLLFYDPILSGNREVACATCHHPKFGTSDGVSLAIGDGGIGLGPDRRFDPDNPPEQRIPRNAQSLWNVAAFEYHTMFHDGRVERDDSKLGGMRTPLDDDMLQGFDSMLAAQTMFPVLSGDEMAGHIRENEISVAVRQGILTGPDGAWARIARRVADNPAYAEAFTAAYPGIAGPGDIRFTDLSNAIAAFIGFEFRSDTAPFDAYLRGEAGLPEGAQQGLDLFYGRAGCSGCHSGPFQTDHEFHAMGMPQIGPGKAAKFESGARDEGRFRVTGDPADLFAFRTPSLRNVALTAPYGHDGAYADLAAFIAAHADPVAALRSYLRDSAILPDMPAGTASDWMVMDDPAEVEAIAAAVTVQPVTLNAEDVAALVRFLDTLTDPVAITGRLGVPDAVPSGLPVPNPD